MAHIDYRRLFVDAEDHALHRGDGTVLIDASRSYAPTTASYTWLTNNIGNTSTGGRFVNQGLVDGSGNSANNSNCTNHACRSGIFGIDNAQANAWNDQGVWDCIGGTFQYVGQAATAHYSLYSNIQAANRTITGCTVKNMQSIFVSENTRTATIAWNTDEGGPSTVQGHR